MEELRNVEKQCVEFSKNLRVGNTIWRDRTQYSQGGKRIPRIFETIVGGSHRIVIVSNHRDYPNDWVFHCHDLNFNAKVLGKHENVTVEDAAVYALNLCRKKVEQLHMAYQKLTF